MKSEKPFIVKVFRGVLYILQFAFEIAAQKSTESLINITTKYENGEIGRSEYMRRRAKMMRD